MAKNKTILLVEYFENFVNEEKHKALVKELEIGEKSGFVKNFNRIENLKNLHAKHLKK